MIRAEKLSVTFGRTVALDSIDFELDEGVTGLFGPNGSGKSTLLRVLAGLLEPRSGHIAMDGAPRSDEDFRRRIGYAGHSSGLYGSLSVEENLTLFCRLYGSSRRRVDEVLVQLGLEDRGRTPVAELSAGLKRRAAVARCLVHEPELLLLDEPYANLDDDAADLVSGAVEAWRGRGRTALIATHGAKKLKAFADGGIILRRGSIVTQGRYERGPRATGVARLPGRARGA